MDINSDGIIVLEGNWLDDEPAETFAATVEVTEQVSTPAIKKSRQDRLKIKSKPMCAFIVIDNFIIF